MRSAEGHLDELRLLELAFQPDGPGNAHAASCSECLRRIDGLAAGREHLLDLDGLDGDLDGAAPLLPPPSLSALARNLVVAEGLVRAAEDGMEILAARLEEAGRSPGFPAVALQAVQLASRLTVRRPRIALEFVGAMEKSLPPPSDDRPSRLVEAELNVLRSQALLYLGNSGDATRLALDGLAELESAGAPLLLVSRARYYAGSALWGETRYEEALLSLTEARDGFAQDGQDSWVGRAEAAIGLVHFSEARFREALHAFDSALERLDPAVDPGPVASTQQNRAGILLNLGRLAEARAAFGQALELSLRTGLQASATTIRVNLLNLGLDEGSFEEVRARGEKLVAYCDREGLAVDAYYARLALAEACAALGNYGAVRTLAETLRGDAPPEIRDDPDATMLLSRLDAGDHEVAGRLRRLRRYLSGQDRIKLARRA
jgi:tetratricopeptide (TPR) repeat protein